MYTLQDYGKMLADRPAYEEAQTQALRNAREYYANGANLDFSATFFERLLRNEPVNPPESVT